MGWKTKSLHGQQNIQATGPKIYKEESVHDGLMSSHIKPLLYSIQTNTSTNNLIEKKKTPNEQILHL